MRTGVLSLVALLSLAIASGGCKKKEEASSDDTEKDEKASKKKKKSGDDDSDDDGKKKKKKSGDDDESSDDDGKKKKKKSGDDDDEDTPKAKKKSAGGALTAEIEGQEVAFKYGRTTGYGSLRVELSNEKLTCKGGAPSDDAYTLAFDLPAGPDGKFYAGQDVGVYVTVNHQRIKLKSSWVPAAFVKVNVEPFKLEGGEKLAGTIDFDHKYVETKDGEKKDWRYKASGKFDLEICDAPYGGYKNVKAGLSNEAPESPVAGKWGPDSFKPKSALAIVTKDFGSGKLYIQQLEFYDAANIDCTNQWSEGRKSAYFYISDIGGGGQGNTLEGTQQPAKPWYGQPKGKGQTPTLKGFGSSGGARAWVKFDKIDHKKNAKLTGTLVAESAPDVKPDEAAKISGTFEAKVCNPW